MRCKTNGKYPRYVLWENVPGVFSSNKGEDFRCVLEEITKIKDSTAKLTRPKKGENTGEILGDNFSLAWRALDAKYFGVPNEGEESSLSQILMEQVPEKYYLSKKACLGILRRAMRKGKEIPEPLKKALIKQSV